MTRPKVSVSLITYNQEKFIAQAMQSVLDQQVSFNFELIVGDDFSTDGTRRIIEDFQEKYPSIVKPILHKEKNPGIPGKLNFLSTIEASQGEYIALLDGDDFWCDTGKLQKQVDFLDRNPDYSICFHGVNYLYDDGKILPAPANFDEEKSFSIEDLAAGNFINVPSVLFRNGLIGELPGWFYDSPVGDYLFHLLNAEHGAIKYFPEIMAVYRVHNASIWSSLTGKAIQQRMYNVISCLLQHPFPKAVIEKLQRQRIDIATVLLLELFYTDRTAFLEKLQIYIANDPALSMDWSLIHYPKLIQSLESSRTYVLSKRLARLKSLLFK